MRHDHIPYRDEDEQDAFTGWRHYLHWKPGERKLIKRRYWRRARRVGKAGLVGALDKEIAGAGVEAVGAKE